MAHSQIFQQVQHCLLKLGWVFHPNNSLFVLGYQSWPAGDALNVVL